VRESGEGRRDGGRQVRASAQAARVHAACVVEQRHLAGLVAALLDLADEDHMVAFFMAMAVAALEASRYACK
jgi:hypothetical protein